MSTLESRLDPASETFVHNRDAMVAKIEAVRGFEAAVHAHGDRAAERFRARGQLLPRERLHALLDPGAPVLELSALAGLGMHGDDGAGKASGGGQITGIGMIAGVRCAIAVNDSAIKGGTISPAGLRKTLRLHEIARENKLPLINLVESGGADLRYQSEIFVDGGRTFANLARLSAAGLPVITVVHGSSTAGGAYLPGLSDVVIAVRAKARIFLAGPPLVKAALGEDADEEALGGAGMHAQVSGTVEHLAEDDAEAVQLAREVVGRLGWNDHQPPLRARRAVPPRLDPEELLGIVPTDPKTPFDLREVIARVVDDSDFFPFKERWGIHTVCGQSAIEGHGCGILANNGPIDTAGAAKATHFIQHCCQTGTPLIYLQNTTGYMVGTRAEQAGIVKHGAKMIQAVANASVPQITVLIGNAFGAGYYGMCGRPYDPRFLFAWPSTRIGVMGGEQAAGVMRTIAEAKAKRAGQPLDTDALDAQAHALRAQLDAESSALFGTARLWDDGLIDPRDTRRVLGIALATCREAASRVLRSTTFGVARP